MKRCATLGLGAAAMLLVACAARVPTAGPAAGRPNLGASVAAADATDDWHVLVAAPFGMLLKDSPIALHEVLLFHETAHAAGDARGSDCFAIDGTMPPRFLGRLPDDYLLCFDHDRLSRIEATVHVSAAAAAQVFARACALWLKDAAAHAATSAAVRDAAPIGPREAAPSTTLRVTPPQEVPSLASAAELTAANAHAADRCDGRDGGIVFAARLDAADVAGAPVPLAMTLVAADAPDRAAAPLPAVSHDP